MIFNPLPVPLPFNLFLALFHFSFLYFLYLLFFQFFPLRFLSHFSCCGRFVIGFVSSCSLFALHLQTILNFSRTIYCLYDKKCLLSSSSLSIDELSMKFSSFNHSCFYEMKQYSGGLVFSHRYALLKEMNSLLNKTENCSPATFCEKT